MESMDLDAAVAAWCSYARPLRAQTLAADRCLGRVLAGDVGAAGALPAVDRSAVDGFAVRVDEIMPGRALPAQRPPLFAGETAAALAAGHVRFVATGALVPAGADAVIPIELVERRQPDDQPFHEATQVAFARTVAVDANLRRAASDLGAGDVALRAGDVVDADRLALLIAASPVDPVAVRRRPRVRVLPTGDELVAAGRAPDRHQITDAVGPAVAARALVAGAVPDLWPAVPDKLAAVADALDRASRGADLVVTIGGVSVGPRDLVPQALVACGGDVVFHRLRLRPGTPVLGGRLGGAFVLGLPGSPAAALTAWDLVARPLLACLLGTTAPTPIAAQLAHDHAKRPVRDDRYLRGAVWLDDGIVRAAIYPDQNAGRLVPLARTGALVLHPAREAVVAAGTRVRVWPLSPIADAPPPWLGDARRLAAAAGAPGAGPRLSPPGSAT